MYRVTHDHSIELISSNDAMCVFTAAHASLAVCRSHRSAAQPGYHEPFDGIGASISHGEAAPCGCGFDQAPRHEMDRRHGLAETRMRPGRASSPCRTAHFIRVRTGPHQLIVAAHGRGGARQGDVAQGPGPGETLRERHGLLPQGRMGECKCVHCLLRARAVVVAPRGRVSTRAGTRGSS